MKISSHDSKGPALSHTALESISRARLRATVSELNYPRHWIANRANNLKARDHLVSELEAIGYKISLQGKYDNVVALPRSAKTEPLTLLCAHYDTVPTTSGADDNSSAIAVCLEAARVLALHSTNPVGIVIFNREEDGLLGSIDFVANSILCQEGRIAEVHNFEMVGYFSEEPGSQEKPAGLPIPLPNKGNFIGVLSNSRSNEIAKQVGKIRAQLSLKTPLITLQSFFGIEKIFADLLRSDHAPFWEGKIPALMWTDTSNFRNPHYHLPSDLPETLDYDAMSEVTMMIVAHLLRQNGEI